MNTITATGKVRDWTGPKENYMKHHEVIEWWCGGGEVEWRHDTSGWSNVEGGFFRPENEYRRKQREPQSGEVWMVDGDACVLPFGAYMQKSNSVAWVRLDGHGSKSSESDCFMAEYSAPTVESFYARKFYEQSMSKDCGFDYEDARKCMDVLKEACRYED